MKKILTVAILVAVLFAGLVILTGCGNEGTTNTSSSSDVLQVPMNVINNVPNTTIMQLYVSGAGVENWGSELLNGQQMPTGTQLTLTLGVDKNNLKWDIKAVDEEGTVVTFRNLDLSEVNTTGGTITLSVEDGNAIATAR